MPGRPSVSRSAITSGVIDAQVLGDDRQVAEFVRAALRTAPRPARAPSGRSTAVWALGRDLPVAGEAAEVVDPHDVDVRAAPHAAARSTSA